MCKIQSQPMQSIKVQNIERLVNKPIRHVFHVDKYDRVESLANRASKIHGCDPNFVVFAEVKNQGICRHFEHSDWLDRLPHTTSVDAPNTVSCYILRDWNRYLTRELKSRVKNQNQLSVQSVRLLR